MMSKARWLWLPALLAISALLALWLGTVAGRRLQEDAPASPPSRVSVEGLSVDAAALDLGEVWEEDPYLYTLPVRNDNAYPVEVSRFLTSCRCAGAEPQTAFLAPGETIDVRIKIDLAFRPSPELGRASRPLAIGLAPVLKSSSESLPRTGWELHATIKSRVTLDRLNLQFGDEPIQNASPLTCKVRATVHLPGASLRASAADPSVTCKVNPCAGRTGEFEVAVTTNPAALHSGPFATTINIEVVSRDGEVLPGVKLPVAGIVRPEVRPVPASILFGVRRVGAVAEATIDLQMPAGEKWEIERTEVDSPEVKVEAVAPAVPGKKSFRVVARITKEGLQASEVRFFVHKPGRDPAPVRMTVSYDGDASGVLSGDDGGKE